MSWREVTSNVYALGAVLGVGATLVMDVSAAVLRRMGFPSGVPVALGAKWINYAVRRGKLFHSTIADTPLIPVSVPLVLAVHYSIGAVLAIAYLFLLDALSLERGSYGLAVAYGAATTVFAWFFMLPAMGYGIAGSKAPRQWRVWLSSVVGHVLYGAGIALFFDLIDRVSRR